MQSKLWKETNFLQRMVKANHISLRNGNSVGLFNMWAVKNIGYQVIMQEISLNKRSENFCIGHNK